MIQALVFDFDGLIIDTEVPIFSAWQETYAQYGAYLEFGEWEVNIGRSGIFDPSKRLEQLTGLNLDRNALVTQTRARSLAMVIDQPILPGILDIITEAANQGFKLGVASSSTEEWVEGHLRRLGLRNMFTSVRCRDHVGVKKPDPAVYNATLEQLGVGKESALAFEDSPPGLHAAKAAGIKCVVIPSILTRHRDFTGADLIIDSMENYGLETLLTILD